MRGGALLGLGLARARLWVAALSAACLVVPGVANVLWAQQPSYSVVYSFQCGPLQGGPDDGAYPYGDLIGDSSGNLYGTTDQGGLFNGGIVYEISSSGTETVLHSFAGTPRDGAFPRAGLVRDVLGNLYGTTYEGGTYEDGTVFEVSASGAESLLHSFRGEEDEAFPFSNLLLDSKGNLYGTTAGRFSDEFGTVFEISPTGKIGELHTFAGPPGDGQAPVGGLIHDSAGNLYGTTAGGGTWQSGTVFELSKGGAETILYNFGGSSDGGGPSANLIRDAAGNLYGTTAGGGIDYGSQPCDGTSDLGCGVVFKVTPSGQEAVLYTFTGGTDGGVPISDLIMDTKGNLYGTASVASDAAGVVFEVTPTGKEKVLHAFTGYPNDGSVPYGGLLRVGNYLYGTTNIGGAYDCGTVYRLTP